MSSETELDVLDLLADAIERFRSPLRARDERTSYLEGQLAFLDAASEAIEHAPSSSRPNELLERVARELGIAFEDGQLEPLPSSQRDAGILAMWSLCLGYVEGVVGGARAAVGAIEEQTGGEGVFETR